MSLLAWVGCSDGGPPPPDPGPCSILLNSPDGWPPDVDASYQRWSISSPRIDATQLVADQVSLALAGPEGRRPGTASHAAAVQFLLARFAEMGLDPVGAGYAHDFVSSEHGAGTNLLARLAGTDADRPCMVVGAHYDGVGCGSGTAECHAADDNASGVAATLAIAAYLKAHPARHCVLFALFDKEEAGLVGSRAFVDAPPEELRPLSEHLAFVMIGDMLSRSSRETLYGATRSGWLGDLFTAVQGETPIALKLERPPSVDAGSTDLIDRSDSGPFAAVGIPTLLLSSGYQIYVHGWKDPLRCTDPAFFAAAAEAELSMLLRGDQSAEN